MHAKEEGSGVCVCVGGGEGERGGWRRRLLQRLNFVTENEMLVFIGRYPNLVSIKNTYW